MFPAVVLGQKRPIFWAFFIGKIYCKKCRNVICAAHLFLMDTASIRELADAVHAQTVFPGVHRQSPIVEPDIIKVATVVYAVRTIRVLVHMVQPVVILIQG